MLPQWRQLSLVPDALRPPSAAADQIHGLALAGVTAKRSRLTLSTAQPNLPLNLKDINNHVYRKGRVDRMEHSASEAIITKLGNDGALFRSFVDGEGRLVGLLYTTPTARRPT
ncbi:MAG: hypothetical protein TREMPRED_004658, partial [Tremellales sp. Tagirdzhanova-0007]